MDTFDVLVGIDWSTRSHQVCVLTPEGAIVRECAVEHTAAAIQQLVAWLGTRSGGRLERIAVAIEIPRGALVESLLEHGLRVYTLNPKQVDRFRDRHSVSGAKDDRRDAYVLADALRTDLHKFRPVALDHPLVLQIREVSRVDEDLREDLNRLTNRLREQIYRIAPQILPLSPAAGEPWFWDLIGRLIGSGSDSGSGRITRRQVESVLRKHRIRRISSETILEAVREESLPLAPGAAEAARSHISLLLPRLKVAHEQRRQCARQLAALMERYVSDDEDKGDGANDLKVLRSIPGVGLGVSAALLAEAAPLLAARNYHALRALSGLAPVTRRSGRSHLVQMRYGCNSRLRNAFYHWARTSIQCDAIAKRYYAELRGRGHTHGRALRSVADRWLRIAMAMLRTRTTYEINHVRREQPAAA
jgi:transposase